MIFIGLKYKQGNLKHVWFNFILVAIQCLESTYGINTQEPAIVKKHAVPRNLLDIFNSQITTDVSNYCSKKDESG